LKKEPGHFEIFMLDIGGWHGYFCVKDWAPFNSSILFSACPYWGSQQEDFVWKL
jgi:hypothetical protein